jgi:membrane protein DedA with SNARE-associated domain
VWAAIWTFSAYYVGSGLKHASGRVSLFVGLAAVVVVVAAIGVLRRHAKRLEQVAEAAYPGPLPD